MDGTKDDAEARRDFWSSEGDFIHRHHVEPRVQLHVPKEETVPIPLEYSDVTRTTHKNLVVVQESRIEYYWNVDVDRSVSDSTGFTKVTTRTEKTSKKDIGGPGGGSHKFKQLPDLRICGLRCLAHRWQNFRHWETLHTVVKT